MSQGFLFSSSLSGRSALTPRGCISLHFLNKTAVTLVCLRKFTCAVTLVCQLFQTFVATRQNQGNYKLPWHYHLSHQGIPYFLFQEDLRLNYKTIRYTIFRSTISLNTYYNTHIICTYFMHINYTHTHLDIYIYTHTYTCTNIHYFIVLHRCCTFFQLKIHGNPGLPDDDSHFFLAIKFL